jgi:hypothetical protein
VNRLQLTPMGCFLLEAAGERAHVVVLDQGLAA